MKKMKTGSKTVASKNSISSPLLLVCLVIFMITSCEEEKNSITETISVTLVKNQSYSYNLPANQSDDPFEITEQASHAKSSTLETSGNSDGLV